MKVDIIEQEKEYEFQPFSFNVKVETEDELLVLLHRLNVPWKVIQNTEAGRDYCRVPNSGASTHNLWNFLEEMRYKQGIK